MRAVRIILGILFLVVAVRGGTMLFNQTGNGTAYPVGAVITGVTGTLLMIFWRKGKHGGG